MEKKQIVLVKRLLVFSLLFLITACNKKDSARIKVALEDRSLETLRVEELRVSGPKFLDTLAFSSAGKLKYNFKLKQPTFYNLVAEDSKTIYLILHPGDKVRITGKSNNITIKGSEESTKLNMLYDSLFVTRALLADIRDKYNRALDDELRNSLAVKYDSIIRVYHKFSLGVVFDNMSSLVAMAALYQEYAPNEFVFGTFKDLQIFKLVTDSLTKEYPKSRHVIALKKNFTSMQNSFNTEKMLRMATVREDVLQDIKLPDTRENLKSFLNLDKRYVFLNFWSEADQLSHKLFKDYNKVFKVYKSKDFTIYNVYMGKSIPTWKKLVKFEEIESWVNVADTNIPGSQVQIDYNVHVLPGNYLIDLEDEKILAKDISPEYLGKELSVLIK